MASPTSLSPPKLPTYGTEGATAESSEGRAQGLGETALQWRIRLRDRQTRMEAETERAVPVAALLEPYTNA